MNVGIIFIGTAKYASFFEGYYDAIKENFLPTAEKTFFVFTDQPELPVFRPSNSTGNIVLTEVEHQEWPYITLYRFKFMTMVAEQLRSLDKIFFIDADLWPVATIEEKDLFQKEFKYIGVQHPGFLDRIGTFETNPSSNANIFDGQYDLSKYRQGCFWGGDAAAITDMAVELDRRIDDDLSRDIVAVWHDESHMNKYFVENNQDVLTLHPGFAQPQEGYDFVRSAFPTKMVHLFKDINEFPRFAGVK
jgi:hypothetical protein